MGTKILIFSAAFFVIWCSLRSSAALSQDGSTQNPLKFILGSQNFGSWKNSISADSSAPEPSIDGTHSTLVLAADRTKRPDILGGFRQYKGGWNITSNHYWASVGSTGAAGFILACLWFVSFGLVLAVQCCCQCRISEKAKGLYSSRRISLILLIVFTCAAATGCILLSVGQNKFHGEALDTLKYVVNQSDYTVQTLRNVTQYLSLAKTINVTQVFLPSKVMEEIDKLNVNLNNAAEMLDEKTSENASKIRRVFHAVQSALIMVAALMLFLSLLGLLLSILRHQHTIYIFVVSGWLLVAVTFVLCGIFVILNNAISDSCMAMKEWVDHPHAETALSSILPCVDQRTTDQTLMQSKVIINDIVNVVNTFIYSYANTDPSQGQDRYYNQSGPPMPPLCYPFDSNLRDRQCGPQEVSIANASMVWKKYTCMVSESGICTSVGRVIPDIYMQLVAAVDESYALEHYTPPLLSLQDCNFVRETFENITSDYCPPLEQHLKILNAGLGLISVGVLLCLLLWIVYANRPQREEVFADISSQIKNSSSRSRHHKSPGNNGDDKIVVSPGA